MTTEQRRRRRRREREQWIARIVVGAAMLAAGATLAWSGSADCVWCAKHPGWESIR